MNEIKKNVFQQKSISYWITFYTTVNFNYIGGVMVSLIVSIAANRGFELQSAQTKDCKIGLYCFSVLYVTLRSKIKD